MANLALTTQATANKSISVIESDKQRTGIAAETIVAGAPVRFDVTTGRVTNSNGTTAAEARVWGLALYDAVAGQAITVVRSGYLDGYDLAALAYDQAVYLSDTDGRIADAAGTVSTVIGRVVPATATTIGTALDKVLSVELP